MAVVVIGLEWRERPLIVKAIADLFKSTSCDCPYHCLYRCSCFHISVIYTDEVPLSLIFSPKSQLVSG